MRAAPVLVAATLGLAGCGAETTTVRVPSKAMLPAFATGQEVEVDQAAYQEERPKPGDVVIALAPSGAQKGECGDTRRGRQPCPKPTRPGRLRFLLRVVAGPGDTVAFRDGVALVNGKREARRRLQVERPCPSCELPIEATVPRNHYFMAGDNRSAASDSRIWGPVPRRSIVGRVVE